MERVRERETKRERGGGKKEREKGREREREGGGERERGGGRKRERRGERERERERGWGREREREGERDRERETSTQTISQWGSVQWPRGRLSQPNIFLRQSPPRLLAPLPTHNPQGNVEIKNNTLCLCVSLQLLKTIKTQRTQTWEKLSFK